MKTFLVGWKHLDREYPTFNNFHCISIDMFLDDSMFLIASVIANSTKGAKAQIREEYGQAHNLVEWIVAEEEKYFSNSLMELHFPRGEIEERENVVAIWKDETPKGPSFDDFRYASVERSLDGGVIFVTADLVGNPYEVKMALRERYKYRQHDLKWMITEKKPKSWEPYDGILFSEKDKWS